MKATFFVTARNKVKHVRRAVESAFAQTYPCHIVLSDQSSTDGTYEEMEKALSEIPMPMEKYAVSPHPDIALVLDREVKDVPRHTVELVRCPVVGQYGMTAANAHTAWAMERATTPWVFQCSADDWSLPDRVAVCMRKLEELEAKGQSCAAIATTMYYLDEKAAFDPEKTPYLNIREDAYVSAGFGIKNLIYGSTIQGWNREFFLKAGSAENVTGDVFHGYLAALDKGYYVVNKPLHVKVEYADLGNMGFQGKMKAAEASGDPELMTRINELNRFQLFELYYKLKLRQQALYPMAHQEDTNELLNMLIAQSVGWYLERSKMHANKWMPGIL